MPYYLNNASSASAGINIPSVVIGATVGDYIEIKAVANTGNPSSNYRVAGQQSGFSNFIEIRPVSAAIACGGSSVTFTTGYTQPAVGSIFTIRFTRASPTTWRCTLNGSVLGSDLFNSNNCTLDAFFRFSSSTTEAFRGGIYYIAISTNGGASNTRYYNPANTSSGTVLVDEVNSANNGTQVGTWPADNSEWVFYSSGAATYTGGAAASYALDSVGGGLALRIAGAPGTFAANTTGGGSRTTSSGAATSYTLDSTGGGSRTTSSGAATSYTIGTVGGGEVIQGAATYTGGASVTFAASASGGGVVIRAGGALVNFAADTAGGATRTTSSGGAITVTLITVGGGEVVGPGYKPTITAPAVSIKRTYTAPGVRVVKTHRAAYTVATQKTYRGATCRL